jgi:regulator of protease activity HflC (stomatin/prohibitin superfamily)
MREKQTMNPSSDEPSTGKNSSLITSLNAGKLTGNKEHMGALGIFIGMILFFIAIIGSIIIDTSMHGNENWIGVWSTFWVLLGIIFMYSLRTANQWEKAVILRLGKAKGLKGPGLFWLWPILDSVAAWVDQRVMVTPFSAEKTLTRDTVPVNVDAVLFWMVWDAEKAALEVENYRSAITWASQTALREIIGQMALADILVGRARMDSDLQKIIDERTTPWGITVQSVEIRDVIIPADLEDAMSRQAQAERERQARVILGESEKQIASSFADAANAYVDNPTALHLRAMNMLFEGMKDKGALVIVPSSAVDSMNLGGMAGLTTLAREQLGKQK